MKRFLLISLLSLGIIFSGATACNDNSSSSKQDLNQNQPDLQAPQNLSIQIENGKSFINNTSLHIQLAATDNNGVTAYYLSENPANPTKETQGWIQVDPSKNYQAAVSFQLTSEKNEKKTVYAWFKDAAENISNRTEASSTLDTVPPQGSLLINYQPKIITSSNQVSVRLTVTTPEGNDKVYGYPSESATALPVSDASWHEINTWQFGEEEDFTLSSADRGRNKIVYAYFRDEAGNISSASAKADLWSLAKSPAPVVRPEYFIKTTSLALGNENQPHISFVGVPSGPGTFTVKYTTIKNGVWQTSIIDSFLCDSKTPLTQNNTLYLHCFDALQSSIATDSDGNVHLSYYDPIQKNLKYATTKNHPERFETSVIDNSAETGQQNFIKIDSEDNIHISYYDAKNGQLKYIRKEKNQTTFQTPIVVDDGLENGAKHEVGQFSSLAIDSKKTVHFSYYDATDQKLKYAKKESTKLDFLIQTVDEDGNVGKESKIAVQNDQTRPERINVYISYLKENESRLEIETASRPSDFEAVAFNKGSRASFSFQSSEQRKYAMSVDSAGLIHLIYYSDRDLVPEYGIGTARAITPIPFTQIWAKPLLLNASTGFYPSMAIDSKGILHTVFIGNSTGDPGDNLFTTRLYYMRSGD